MIPFTKTTFYKKNIHAVIDGSCINRKSNNEIFYKIIKKNYTHKNFKYKLGINEDILKFNPSGNCSAGGLYITDYINIVNYYNYGNIIAYVSIPDDAKCYLENGKIKCNKIYINSFELINNFNEKNDDILFNINYYYNKSNNNTYASHLNIVKHNGLFLALINKKDHCHEICMEAVKQNYKAIIYVEEQTEDICFEAVTQNGYMIKYIKNQTENLCIEAVKKNPFSIQFIKNKTHNICMEAIKNNPYSIQFIQNQTEDICLEAVKINANVKKLITIDTFM